MAETTVNQPNKSTDLGKLHIAIEDMDALAQGGFSQICAIAQLALAALQTPEGYRHPENIVQALRAIKSKAEDIDNCINSTAEQVGCNYHDKQLYRRWDAQRAAREVEQKNEQLAHRLDARLAAQEMDPESPQRPEADGPDLKLVH